MKVRESGLMVPDDYARGGGKVELFNERDKLVDRLMFKNFISAKMLQDQKWHVRQAYGGGIEHVTVTHNDQSTTFNGHGVFLPRMWYPHYLDQGPRELMRWLTLTNDAVATDPVNDRRIKGSVVGYADKSLYVGADPLRGSLNAIESTRTDTLARWVFDWPTSAGNGTFRSIHWGYDNATNVVTGEWKIYYGYTVMPDFTGQPASQIRGGTWVAGSGQSEFWSTHAYDGANPVTSGYKITRRRLSDGVVLDSFTQPVSGEAIADVGDGLWLGWWADNTLRKYSYAGALLASFSLGAADPVGGTNANSMTYDASTGHLYVNRNGSSYIQKYTTAGVLVASYGPFPGTLSRIALSSTTLAAQSNVGIHITDVAAPGTIIYTVTGPPSSGYSLLIDDLVSHIWSQSSTVMYPSRHIGNLASRALLPADVTKTNLQTMKITYEFDFS